ncbi:tape measure protein [Acinetobacter radioresistens]|uniref:tape measure protein n=1 Tax=Acinetobacter radioresistens TaxID=40216 RepID=UPI0021CDCF19|nr:tape measure protein [Acinetobacter radioresistens]MCU4567959.1 tape measure protein [Acinetobacter radioresistens]
MAQESHLRVVIDSRQALRDARAISTELQSIEKNGDYAAKSMNGASTAVREFAGYMAGIVTVGAAISKMDAYTGINNQLKLVTNSQVQLTGAMNETFAIAQRSRSSWESVTQVYQKLAMNAEAAGIAQKDIGRLTETISKGIALSGSSSEQAAAAIMQLGQSLGAGKLSGDEFNSVMENGYGVMQLLAKGMDVPIGQLKKLAGEGKLTSEVVTQALLKMSSTADAEFAKTDATIGQSLGMLSNAVTQFVGEAGKGSGAANLLSGSIQALAGNLDLIADTAVVGGVAYLTKTIVGQTIATQGAISASVARRASMLGELESVVQATTAEVSRTAAIAQLRNMQLADAQATAARMTGIQRLAYVQNTVIPLEAKATAATAAHTAAVEADTLAQDANSAARSRAAKLFTVLGGWTGVLTIGVAGLAAGYMYLKDRTAEANKKLEEQANVAKKAKDELIALKGLEKDSAINDMTAAFERQNKALAESSSRINMQLNAIEQLYKGNKEIVQVVQDARNGTISMSEAIQRFNELRISKEVYESVKANTAEFEKNAKEATNTKVKLNLFGVEVELSGRKAQTAVAGIDENTKALKENKAAAEKAKKAQKDYSVEIQKFIEKSFENSAKNSEMATLQLKGFNQETAELIAQAREAEGLTGTNKPLSMATFAAVTRELMTRRQALAVQEQQNKSEKERLAILEQQGKVLQVNSKVQANAAKYNFSQLESKYKLPSGTLASIHMIESKGNVNAYNKTTGASGGFQFLKGTADQYGVKNRNDLAQSAEGAAKYMSYLLKLFKGDLEKAVRAYHAGEGNVQKGKNIGKYNNQYWKDFQGYMAGQSGLSFDAEFTVKDFEKILDDRTRLLAEQAETRKRIEYEAADEIDKIRQSLADRIQEIEAADFSADKTKEYSRQAKIQAENEIKIIQAQQQDKLDAFNDYNKSEEALVKQHYARMQRDLALDLTLTEQQRKQATESIRKQEMHEIALIELAKQERLFQAEQAYSHEIYRIQESGRIEREQIRLTTKDAAEASRLIEASFKKQKQAANDALKSISEEWRSIQSRFSGMGEVGYINQEFKGYNETADKYRDAQRSAAEEDAARKREQLWRDEEVNRTISAEEAAQRRIEIEQNVATRLQEIDLEHFQNRIELEKQYYLARAELGLTYGEEIAGNWADVFKQMYGEQSSAYAAMFALEKGFAVAKALMAAPEAYSKAYNAVVGIPYVGPYIAPVMGGAAAAAQVAQAAIIKGVNFTGYETGGYTGNYGKSEVAGVVHGQEYVLNAEATRRVGINTLNAINSGADIQAERQAQANVKAQSSNPQPIESNVRVGIFDDRADMLNQMYGREGEKVIMYHLKRNGMVKA